MDESIFKNEAGKLIQVIDVPGQGREILTEDEITTNEAGYKYQTVRNSTGHLYRKSLGGAGETEKISAQELAVHYAVNAEAQRDATLATPILFEGDKADEVVGFSVSADLLEQLRVLQAESEDSLRDARMLVKFLWILLQDDMTIGRVETILQDLEMHADEIGRFDDKNLLRYVQSLADRLTKK